MPTECISYKNTGFFSSLICDYLDEKEDLKAFYNHFPTLENFKKQIDEKGQSFRSESRNLISGVLKDQYRNINTSSATNQNIEALKQENTFTITTGHQLNLFTGPLYFLYKIISAINLTSELKQTYPDYNFVPVYWMATEDHDFEEINYFNFQDVKVQWNRESNGGVGELDTKGLEDVLKVFGAKLGGSPNANYLKELFKKAYLEHGNLADATRYLANELFKEYGLVVIDANDKGLKKLFIPYLEREIKEQISFEKVSETNQRINKLSNQQYKIQVNPREINLFYLDDNLRERIIKKEGVFSVNNTDITWTESELLEEINNHPEKFSPNVLLRPLYQEVILPNLCYIGGGGELAYWFQLKEYFKAVEIPFPILLLRNSVVIQSEKQAQKLKKLNIDNNDLFLDKNSFINKKVRQISNIDIDFSSQKATLEKQFEDLYKLAEQTDKSFLGAVSAQERKQIKGLEHLEKRLLKAQKKKLSDQVLRVAELQTQLFPNQSLQERQANFSEFYLEYGDQLIQQLVLNLQPLKSDFLILEL